MGGGFPEEPDRVHRARPRHHARPWTGAAHPARARAAGPRLGARSGGPDGGPAEGGGGWWGGGGWGGDRVGLMRDRLISNCNETWQVMSAIASSPGAKWGDSITGIWTASGDLA